MALLLQGVCGFAVQTSYVTGAAFNSPTPHFLLQVALYRITIMSKTPPRKPPETSLKGRDARTGVFIPVAKARQNPANTVVERVPLPGKGRK